MKTFLHHLFIPSETNNYRAKALHLDFLTYYLVIIVCMSFLFQKTSLPDVLGVAADMSTARLFELTNQTRVENGLGLLQHNTTLDAAACDKARDMFTNDYWSHFGPNGQSPWNFILGAGYRYEYAGENLCKSFRTSDGCFKAWMDSPSHRNNLLGDKYTDVGFCALNGQLQGDETTLVVQMFGTPLEKPAFQFTQAVAAEEKTDTIKPTIFAQANTEPPKKTTVIVEEKKSGLLSNVPFGITGVFLIILALTLLSDFYYAYKLRVVRLTGHHILHLTFLIIIGISLFILRKGAIL